MSEELRFKTRRTHGLVPISAELLQHRREAARWILATMQSGPDRVDPYVLREAVEVWRKVFAAVMLQRTSDWFLMSSMTGHPAPWTARRFVVELGILSDALLLNEPYKLRTSLKQLFNSELRSRLKRFQQCSRPEGPRSYELEANWLYLLRANEEWGVVNLGTIVGNIEQAVAEMDDLNPDLAPYGIIGAWRVIDVEIGYRLAAHALWDAFVQTDFYAFEQLADVDAMKESITRVLATRNQLDLSLPPEEGARLGRGWVIPAEHRPDDVDEPIADFRP
jgi:hypothetical protein